MSYWKRDLAYLRIFHKKEHELRVSVVKEHASGIFKSLIENRVLNLVVHVV
mgnify:CR=1 FL=1